ncbi:MAG: cupin domain-containing protein [Betaproteobacteria bacterium]
MRRNPGVRMNSESATYFVLSGRATLRVAGQERDVAPGNILLVRAMTIHSFFDKEEDLIVVGVFGSQTSAVRRESYSGGGEAGQRVG